jgi:hypothetical protein
LTSTAASVASANVGTAVITTLTATGASIASANAGNVQATIASVGSANLGTAVITTGTLTNLTATSASVASVNAGVALVTTGTVTNLTSTAASIASANIGVAAIGSLSFTGASIASLNAGVANITDLRVAGASVTSANLGTAVITTGNLTFSSTAQRITGDMGNATLGNRLYFQTSVTNGNTDIMAVPNGTGTLGQVSAWSSSDPANSSLAALRVTASTDVRLISSNQGTGTLLPMTFYTGGSERVRIDTSGNVGIGTASPTAALSLDKANVAFRGQLTINGGSTGIGQISFYEGTTTATDLVGQLYTSNNQNSVHLSAYKSDGVILFETNANTERMRIDSAGRIGLGGTPDNTDKFSIKGALPSASNFSIGIGMRAEVPSTTTTAAQMFTSLLYTQAASFTLTDFRHFHAQQVSIGAGSAITNQYGYFADSSLTGATNNYGFFSNIASGSNRWNFYAAGTAQNYFAGNTAIGVTATSTVRLYVRGSDSTSGNFACSFENSSGNSLFYLRNDGLVNTGNQANSPYNNTTGSAANVFVDSGGTLQRSTSSLRYKSDVTTATHGLADVLKLRSVTYKGKNDGDKVFGGLIAEEVHDAGLTEFVAYDKEGRPDAIHYGNMVALLVKAVQELTARVAELEAK